MNFTSFLCHTYDQNEQKSFNQPIFKENSNLISQNNSSFYDGNGAINFNARNHKDNKKKKVSLKGYNHLRFDQNPNIKNGKNLSNKMGILAEKLLLNRRNFLIDKQPEQSKLKNTNINMNANQQYMNSYQESMIGNIKSQKQIKMQPIPSFKLSHIKSSSKLSEIIPKIYPSQNLQMIHLKSNINGQNQQNATRVRRQSKNLTQNQNGQDYNNKIFDSFNNYINSQSNVRQKKPNNFAPKFQSSDKILNFSYQMQPFQQKKYIQIPQPHSSDESNNNFKINIKGYKQKQIQEHLELPQIVKNEVEEQSKPTKNDKAQNVKQSITTLANSWQIAQNNQHIKNYNDAFISGKLLQVKNALIGEGDKNNEPNKSQIRAQPKQNKKLPRNYSFFQGIDHQLLSNNLNQLIQNGQLNNNIQTTSKKISNLKIKPTQSFVDSQDSQKSQYSQVQYILSERR